MPSYLQNVCMSEVTEDRHCAHMYTCTQIHKASVLLFAGEPQLRGCDGGVLALRRYSKGELILRIRNLRNNFIIWNFSKNFEKCKLEKRTREETFEFFLG